jgi:hypothetical protein
MYYLNYLKLLQSFGNSDGNCCDTHEILVWRGKEGSSCH